MLLSAVSVLVVAQSSSEIPEGLMNNPVYCTTPWTSSSQVFKTASAFCLGFAKERVERRFSPSNVPSGCTHLRRGQQFARELRVERACRRIKIRKILSAHIISVVQPYVALQYVNRSKYAKINSVIWEVQLISRSFQIELFIITASCASLLATGFMQRG